MREGSESQPTTKDGQKYSSAALSSKVHDAVPAREVVVSEPGSSFRTRVHGYPDPLAGWHYHPELELHLITASRGTVIAGDHVGSFTAGEVYLIGSGLPHDWISDLEPGELVEDRDYVIQIDPTWLRRCHEVLPELAEIQGLLRDSARGLVFGGETRARGEELVRRVLHSQGGRRLVALLDLLVELSRRPEDRSPLAGEWFTHPADRDGRLAVEAGIAYIFDNLDGPLSLGRAAALANMSDSTFSRYFKAASGLNFSEMVRKLRLANACRLLESSDLTVARICSQTGYQNLSNFNRQFRAELGMTPGEYRAATPQARRTPLRPPSGS